MSSEWQLIINKIKKDKKCNQREAVLLANQYFKKKLFTKSNGKFERYDDTYALQQTKIKYDLEQEQIKIKYEFEQEELKQLKIEQEKRDQIAWDKLCNSTNWDDIILVKKLWRANIYE